MVPVGAKPLAPEKNSAAATKVAVQCKCGQRLQVKTEFVGKTVTCPGCSQPLRVPTATAKSTAAGNQTAKDASNMDELFKDVGLADTGGSGRKCPECRSPMKPEAIICIDCGYNENLGRRMKVQRPVTADDRANRAGKRSRK